MQTDSQQLSKQFITERIHLPSQQTNSYNLQNDEIISKTQSAMFSTQIKQNLNRKQMIAYLHVLQAELQQKIQLKNIYTRQNISQINTKQRHIRTNQYKKITNHKQHNAINLQQSPISENGLVIRELCSSQIHRIERNSASIANSINRRSSSAKITGQGRKTRPQSVSNLSKAAVNQLQVNKLMQLRLHNPLVIYPFQSKLKSKRVDENPKILANIISKKYLQMEKKQLYGFVTKLMRRRQQ